MREKTKTIFIICLGGWLLLSTTLVTIFVFGNPIQRAVIGMGWGLIILWIFTIGPLMVRYRESIKGLVQGIKIRWQIKFIVFATLLALLEEAITVSMTNAAPLFGVKIGEAYITASTNYLDVVFFHSVIAFIPLFIGWAWVLTRYQFSPFEVFLLFGITGTLAEAGYGGIQHLREFGLWIFVYGLMIYLPAYTIPEERGAKPIRFWDYLIAIPYTYVVGIPFYILFGLMNHLIFHHSGKMRNPVISRRLGPRLSPG